MLQAFFNAADVEDFRSCFSYSVPELENANNAELERTLATQIEGLLQGEGTNGPSGSCCELSPIWHLSLLLTAGIVCAKNSEEVGDKGAGGSIVGKQG
jgi:hypothetical protein